MRNEEGTAWPVSRVGCRVDDGALPGSSIRQLRRRLHFAVVAVPPFCGCGCVCIVRLWLCLLTSHNGENVTGQPLAVRDHFVVSRTVSEAWEAPDNPRCPKQSPGASLRVSP